MNFFEQLKTEIEVPPYFVNKDNVDIRLWIGDHGVITTTHCDESEGLLCVLKGTKKFVLINRKHFIDMYPNQKSNKMFLESTVSEFSIALLSNL
jgi:hypothetical protein